MAQDASTGPLQKNRNGSSGAVHTAANVRTTQSQRADVISLKNQRTASRNGSLNNYSRGGLRSEVANQLDRQQEEILEPQGQAIRTLEEQKKKLQTEIDNMHKQALMLTNEIKSKSNLLDKVKKAKPGAPAPKPPGGPHPVRDSSEFKNPSAAIFVELKDEIAAKDAQIDMLNDRIIVQDHELKELRSLKGNLDKLRQLEDQLDGKDQTIAELKKKVAVQEEAISSWIEAMDERKNMMKEKQAVIDKLEPENEALLQKVSGLEEEIAKVAKESGKKGEQIKIL